MKDYLFRLEVDHGASNGNNRKFWD